MKKKQLQNDAKNHIEALKRTHEQEVIRLKLECQKKINAEKHAMEQKYSQFVKEAKKNKYCQGCGNAKPLDIYVCDMECQRLCWLVFNSKIFHLFKILYIWIKNTLYI